MLPSRAVLPLMMEQGGGSIINVASDAGKLATPGGGKGGGFTGTTPRLDLSSASISAPEPGTPASPSSPTGAVAAATAVAITIPSGGFGLKF